MTSYQERSEINRRLANQAYFDAKLKKVEPQKKDVRIGGMDGQTGRYQVFHADGGFSNNGVRTFDGTPPSDRFVRGQQNPNSNAITLGYRDYVRTEFVNRVEDEEITTQIIFLFLKENKLYVGGDRDEAELIYTYPTEYESKDVLFVYGSIQKTGINSNAFTANFVVKLDPPVPREEDITEPITYWFYTIKSIDDEGQTDTLPLSDIALNNGIYQSETLTIYKQVLAIPQYPNRAVPVLLQDGKATLNDRGFYDGFDNTQTSSRRDSFAFQHGFFSSFEIAVGTISEIKSGEWHNLVGELEPPPQPSFRPNGSLDSLPQFNPDNLQYHEYPFETEYDYTPVKYAYDPATELPKRYRCSDGECIEYINGAYTSLEECNNARIFRSTVEGLLTYNDGTGRTLLYSQALGIPLIFESYGEAGTAEAIVEQPSPGLFNFIVVFTIRNLDGSYTTTPFLIAGFGLGTSASPTNQITSNTSEVVACPALPPLPEDYNEGCIDRDSVDYDELDDPSMPDRRTTKTCTYNPFRLRGNQRVVTVDLALKPSPTPEVPPELIAPVITPSTQNITVNNPIKKLVNNGEREILQTPIYSVPTEKTTTSQRVTIEYFPETMEGGIKHISANEEFLETSFLAVKSDKTRFLTKKFTLYLSQFNDLIDELPFTPADPEYQEEVQKIYDRNAQVIGLSRTVSYLQFQLPPNFFSIETPFEESNVFELYTPNYVGGNIYFVVPQTIKDDIADDPITDGTSIAMVKTSIQEVDGEVVIAHTAFEDVFIGDQIGDIVDASFFTED